MKKLLSYLSIVLLTFGAVSGSVFCLITAFNIPATNGWLLMFLLIAAMICTCSVLFSHKWVWYLFCLLPVCFFVWYFLPQIKEGLALTVYRLSTEYAKAFENISVIRLSAFRENADATVFFAAIGAGLCILVCAYLQANDLQWGAIVATAPFLVASLIMLQTEPDVWCQVLLVGAYALILLSAVLRNYTPQKSGGATLLLAVPLVLVLLILVLFVSPKEYHRSDWSESLKEKAGTVADKIDIFQVDQKTGEIRIVSPVTAGLLGSHIWNKNLDRFDLSGVGPQKQLQARVMEVKASVTGSMYLRGSSMAVYEDNRWSALPDKAFEALSAFPQTMQLPVSGSGEVAIKTDRRAGIYYTPYTPVSFPENAQIVSDGYIKNPLQETQYGFQYAETFMQSEEYDTFVYQNYLNIPETTRNSLLSLNLSILDDNTVNLQTVSLNDAHHRAILTADFVRNSASYSLDTPRVPEGEDFTAWFLSESDTGYCVHFATAAVILLRMQHIPARFVTGYLVHVQEDEWTEVTEADAHAWVEYYTDGGWCMLDPTPAAIPESLPLQENKESSDQTPDPTPLQTEHTDEESENHDSQDTQEKDTNPAHSESRNGKAEGDAANATKANHVPMFVWFLAGIPLLLGLWNLIIRTARNRKISKGTAEARISALYHEILRLASLADQDVSDEIVQIAQQARFSNHTPTVQQSLTITQYYNQQRASLLQNTTLPGRLLYIIIFAI